MSRKQLLISAAIVSVVSVIAYAQGLRLESGDDPRRGPRVVTHGTSFDGDVLLIEYAQGDRNGRAIFREPDVRRIADRAFIVGQDVGSDRPREVDVTVWFPWRPSHACTNSRR